MRVPCLPALVMIGMTLLGGCRPAAMAGRPGIVDDATARLESEIHELVNRHRRSRGLPPLALDPRITRVARLHSSDMAADKVGLGHDGFADRVAMLGETTVARAAENVAYDSGPRAMASAVVQGWLRSSGHRENIEGPYDRTGIGAARTAAGELYVTEIFVRAKAPKPGG
jgi:uncharacterized protein YkwD